MKLRSRRWAGSATRPRSAGVRHHRLRCARPRVLAGFGPRASSHRRAMTATLAWWGTSKRRQRTGNCLPFALGGVHARYGRSGPRMSTGLYRAELLGAPRLKVADVSTAPAVIATRPATGSNSLPNQLLRAVAVLALRLSPCPFPDAFVSVVRRSALDWCPTASDRMKRPRSSRRTYRLWVPVSMSSRFAMVMSSSRHSVHSRLHEVKENHQATAVRLRLPCTSPFLQRHEAPGR